MEGDDIDTETLQSQIDLSMSLVHNLVSSWMKPSQKASIVSSNTAQKELEEYMRRPPRLGVGAPIPETSTASRETARLKTQLIRGNKRTRNEHGDTEKQLQSSDDGEESRGAIMRKKVKIDPFGGEKKRKVQVNGLPTPHHTPGSSQAQISVDIGKPTDSMEVHLDALRALPVEQTTSPQRKKKKHKRAFNAEAAKLSSPPPSPRRDIAHNHAAVSIIKQGVTSPSASVRPDSPQTPVKNAPLPKRHASTMTPKAALSPVHVRASQDTPGRLNPPLLNLDGPPPYVSDPENDSRSGSPKKRRRRRKKKKHSLPNCSPDNI